MMRFAVMVIVVAGLCLGAVGVANSLLPASDRITKAVAQTNRSSGRNEAIKLDLALRIGGGDPIATGQLVTHPTGMARLELEKRGEFIERHILQGNEHLVTRNGNLVESPRAFLPPLFLLQATSSVSLEAAMRAHGVDVDALGVAPCGDGDCYVLGDPALVPPPVEVPEPEAGDDEATGDELAESDPLADDEPVEAEEDEPHQGPRATVWIDTDSYELRRLQSREGVRVLLGPISKFEKLRVPAWLEIREPRQVPVTLDIVRAAKVAAPANAFGREWLFGAPPASASDRDPAGARDDGTAGR